MNPSLAGIADVEKTVAVGCSLVRAALGMQIFGCSELLAALNCVLIAFQVKLSYKVDCTMTTLPLISVGL